MDDKLKKVENILEYIIFYYFSVSTGATIHFVYFLKVGPESLKEVLNRGLKNIIRLLCFLYFL